jgi:hypothetical protein
LPCNKVLKRRPAYIYLHHNKAILEALEGCQTLLRESTTKPTRCRELVSGWPDYIGVVDASGHGVGGVVFGELSACTLVVFRWEWPDDIKNDIKTLANPTGRLTNSDLKMAGLLMLWLVIEGVCPDLREKRITLFSDNMPTVSWVMRLASKLSLVAEQLVQALALCLKTMHACPLTPMHIKGKCNAIANIPSQSFGSNPLWTCTSDSDLLTLFNTHFPLPKKHSWTVYHPNCTVAMRMISALRMKPFVLDDWRQLPTRGRCIGKIGAPTSNTCAWIHTYNRSHIPHESNASQDLQPEHEQGSMDKDDISGVVNASGHGVGRVVFGELSACTPVVFRWEWPDDIKNNIKTLTNPTGRLTNSNLKMAGLLMLWLVIEGVCPDLREKRITLFSDNTPTVSWVMRLASKWSLVAEQLVQALALCLKTMHSCPLTPMHIKGKCNAIADIPSQSFSSNPLWTCTSDSDLLTLFNTHFQLPEKHSWTVYHPNCAVAMRMISALRMKPFVLDDWRQLPTRGRCIGKIGAPTSNTCAWIRTYNRSHIPHESNASQDLQPEHEQGSMDKDDRSRIARSLALSRPLARRSL